MASHGGQRVACQHIMLVTHVVIWNAAAIGDVATPTGLPLEQPPCSPTHALTALHCPG